MTSEHDKHYNADFYAGQTVGSLSSARRVVPIVMESLRPHSVVDVGCGVGTWLKVFSDAGVETIVGMDGDYVDRSMLQIDRQKFFPTDLRETFQTDRQFDLAICLEVAEHLSPESGLGLVKSLTKAAPYVLFSAAIPGQIGTNHINEQWQDYWRELFSEEGFVAVDLVRPQVWGLRDVEPWYQQNIVLYCRSDVQEANPRIHPVGDHLSLNIVHADIFSRVRDDGAQYLSKTLRGLPNLFASAIARRVRSILS